MKIRYIFTGKLVMESALHLGGGKLNSTFSDSPVMKTPSGLPYIPGSSFKGVFRSTAERLCENLGLKTCLLEVDSGNDVCLTSMDKGNPKRKEYEKFREERRNNAIDTLLKGHLCHTCKLFGSSFKSSKAYFKDLYVDQNSYSGTTEVRDGVVIDRDSETAVDGLKFDYETVPASTAFEMEVVLEDPTDEELALFLITMAEFKNGYAFIGGNRSRGLGRCKVEGLEMWKIDFSNAETFSRYLLKGYKNEENKENFDRILADNIKVIIRRERDAEEITQ